MSMATFHRLFNHPIYMNKKINLFFLLLLWCLWTTDALCAQEHQSWWAMKTNLLYDATGSVNVGVEWAMSSRWSVDVSGNYNAWDFARKRKWHHLLVQPEVRYWFCESGNGHFIGVHLHGCKFNIAHVKMPFGLWKELRHRRYQGDLWGGGFTYGYSWLLSKHWNVEAAVGVGYARVRYDKYPCASCGRLLDSGKKNYFGPTKAALSMVYVF